MVVLQGLCNKLNNIKLTAVNSVQPPAFKMSPVAFTESNSNITPAPEPPEIPVTKTVSIKIVGITISLAGIATIYANKITPFNPKRKPNPSKESMVQAAILSLPIKILEINQITAPAGAANTTARHKTIKVLSINDV